MNFALRAIILLALVSTGLAILKTTRYLRGDLEMYRLPTPNQNMPLPHAMVLEGSITRGLRLNPVSWQGHVQKAGYLTIQQKYDAALKELEIAMSFNKAMPAMFLEATIHAEMKRYDEASTAFERLYRLSVVDRTVLQHLMRIYSERPKTPESIQELQRLAMETDMRWPGTFDAYVALANARIDDPEMMIYLPLILKYFVLASIMPQEGYNRPEPHAYELSHVVARVKTASGMVGYQSDWARW